MSTDQPPPQSREVQAIVDAIHKACAEIVHEYRWHEVALYGTGGGSATDGGRTPTHESRPAENQAMSAAERSGQLRHTAAVLSSVQKVLRSEARQLRPKPGIVERPDSYPPLISPNEFDQLTDAKQRREARGEGWGRG